MVIRKVGNEYCVFSKKGKNLGCSKTLEGAQKRLRQVETFKHMRSKSDMLNDETILNNLDKNKIVEQLQEGTVAGLSSDKILDKREHFPVITPNQAISSMNRVMKLGKTPDWYSGSLDELKFAVYAGIKEAHPKLDLKVSVPVTVALSDGQTTPETSKTDIKDPNDVEPSRVKQADRPTIAEIWEQESEGDRLAIANKLMDMLKKKEEHLKAAKKLTERLYKSGLSGEEFLKLNDYIQEDILHELMRSGTVAKRQNILKKMMK
jgi:hypothetical protein